LSETVRADAREGNIGMQLGELAKAHPAVAIGSYPFFDPQHGPNTNVVLRARDPQKLAFAKRAVEVMLERVRRARSRSSSALSRRKQGSSPLGSVKYFKDLADFGPSASNTCPINVCGQRWTIRFAAHVWKGGRLGTNAPIVKDAARFETGTRKCGLMKNPHSRRPPGARSRQVIG